MIRDAVECGFGAVACELPSTDASRSGRESGRDGQAPRDQPSDAHSAGECRSEHDAKDAWAALPGATMSHRRPVRGRRRSAPLTATVIARVIPEARCSRGHRADPVLSVRKSGLLTPYG